MRGSTVILNDILHLICMGIINVGITVIDVCCYIYVNKDCMFGGGNAVNACPSDEGTPAM